MGFFLLKEFFFIITLLTCFNNIFVHISLHKGELNAKSCVDNCIK